VRQAGGKVVSGWAFEGDLDPASLKSNTFALEWPPKSGKMREFPEVDRAGWFSIEEAGQKILPGQVGLLDVLVKIIER
jgi:predicted NUDIX family NTP pyrophosphohydrolase